MVAEGQTNQEIRTWFAERYGDFVLFRPPSRGLGGFLLWGAPFIFLLAGGALAFAISRNRRTSGRVEAVAPEDSN